MYSLYYICNTYRKVLYKFDTINDCSDINYRKRSYTDMKKDRVFSICGMCTGRCPVEVEVEGGRVKLIRGNRHYSGSGKICARGAAGVSFLYDRERPQYPMLRNGARGSGSWKKISWDEALDFVSGKLSSAIERNGAKTVALSDRGGPTTDFQKAFIRALGSPNYFNHHATCSNSVHNAHMSIAGLARNQVGYDYINSKYLVLYGRNLFESLVVGEVNDVLDMIESGGRVVYIDPRWTYTASKASESYIIRPGSDYAFNLALIHVILQKRLYNEEFVTENVIGLEKLREFVSACTPEWAEKETGISEGVIKKIAFESAEASPAVIFHPGWMTAWGSDDFYLRRSIYTLNALMGSYEAKGGLFINKTPKDLGVNVKSLLSSVPEIREERFDGAGTKFPHLGPQWGLGQMLPDAIESESPYPIRAYIAMRHDPLASMPDPDRFRKALSKLDLLVSIDVNYSETAWFSDIILPESTFLERTDHVIARNGLNPKLIVRKKAVDPVFDTKARSFIFTSLARRLGIGKFFPYESIEEYIEQQLSDTDFTLEDFNEKGFVELSDKPLWRKRKEGLQFKTPSGKLELYSERPEKKSIPSFIKYNPPPLPEPGSFRLLTGKKAVHTQGRTTLNNAVLNELASDNYLWINRPAALNMGITEGEEVEISGGGNTFTMKVRLTDHIHREAVFMLHGFGDSVPLRSRSYNKGVSDVKLQSGLLKASVGGNCPLTECEVKIRKI